MRKTSEPYRIRYTTPDFKATHKELMKHNQFVNSLCVVANSVLGGYELKIKMLEVKNKWLVTDNVDKIALIKNLEGVKDNLVTESIKMLERVKILLRKVEELETEKYPPMDKIKDLPEVAEQDLPFLTNDGV